MKFIPFHCNNCENKRTIIVKKIDSFYIVGNCSICKEEITINHKKLKKGITAKKLTILMPDSA